MTDSLRKHKQTQTYTHTLDGKGKKDDVTFSPGVKEQPTWAEVHTSQQQTFTTL